MWSFEWRESNGMHGKQQGARSMYLLPFEGLIYVEKRMCAMLRPLILGTRMCTPRCTLFILGHVVRVGRIFHHTGVEDMTCA
jgi:hypothetical protein